MLCGPLARGLAGDFGCQSTGKDDKTAKSKIMFLKHGGLGSNLVLRTACLSRRLLFIFTNSRLVSHKDHALVDLNLYRLMMRKFAVAQSFLCYLEKYRKTNSDYFPVDDQEIKYSTLYIATSLHITYVCERIYRLN